jgi:hypothetical protein
MKLLLICILRILLSHSFIFFRFYFFINVFMVLFLFDNVICVLLLLWLCIFIVCLCMTTLTVVFPCFFLSCNANTRVKPAKTGARPALFLIFVLFYVFFVLFYVIFVLLCVLIVLWRFLCIVCVYMCAELLPPGGYQIAVKYIICWERSWRHVLYRQALYFCTFPSTVKYNVAVHGVAMFPNTAAELRQSIANTMTAHSLRDFVKFS